MFYLCRSMVVSAPSRIVWDHVSSSFPNHPRRIILKWWSTTKSFSDSKLSWWVAKRHEMTLMTTAAMMSSSFNPKFIQDTINQENKSRRFVISYRLGDDMISIYEPKTKNSGLIGGKYLERTRIAKPGSSPDKPIYYGPQDFCMGAVIDAFRTRFIITGADDFTINFMDQRPEFSSNYDYVFFINSEMQKIVIQHLEKFIIYL